jgi:hypothetical protein
MTPYTRMFQFMVAGLGCRACGKNVIMNANMRNKTETTLIGRPKRPREKRDASSGSPRMRFNIIQEMETI